MMAKLLATIMAAPMPCRKRRPMTMRMDCDSESMAVMEVNSTRPVRNSLRRPKMSPSRPMISRNTDRAMT